MLPHLFDFLPEDPEALLDRLLQKLRSLGLVRFQTLETPEELIAGDIVICGERRGLLILIIVTRRDASDAPVMAVDLPESDGSSARSFRIAGLESAMMCQRVGVSVDT